MGRTVADVGCALVVMHMRGSPQTMQPETGYDDLLSEVCQGLRGSVEAAVEAGVPRDRVIVDPGIGFGKSAEGSLLLLRRLGELRIARVPDAGRRQSEVLHRSGARDRGAEGPAGGFRGRSGRWPFGTAPTSCGSTTCERHGAPWTWRGRYAAPRRGESRDRPARPGLRWQDIVDILLVAFVIYRIFVLIKGTRALQILVGLAFLVVAYVGSQVFELFTLHWILNAFLSSIILVVVVLFQNEIRRALAHVGVNPVRVGARGTPTTGLRWSRS